MFELKIGLKYLTPRWKEISVSIISIISICVIALVVWLIVVFFSVTDGLVKSWTDKLVALTAPIRITPREEYFRSYYHLIDTISSASDYTPKSIHEKLQTTIADPYDPEMDEEVPKNWPRPILNPDGTIKDLVKEVYDAIAEIQGIKDLTANDYEMSVATLNLQLNRQTESPFIDQDSDSSNMLTQMSYIGSFDASNPFLSRALLDPDPLDIQNSLKEMSKTKSLQTYAPLSFTETQKLDLHHILDFAKIKMLRTARSGWKIPRQLLPQEGTFNIIAQLEHGALKEVIIPLSKPEKELLSQNEQKGELKLTGETLSVYLQGQTLPVPDSVSLVVSSPILLHAELIQNSIELEQDPSKLLFHVKGKIQNIPISGITTFNQLEIAEVEITKKINSSQDKSKTPIWVFEEESTDHHTHLSLPQQSSLGDGIVLPKNFRETGVHIGDRGFLSYYLPTASAMQEQKIPIYVAGFYDPGIIPIGGKYILMNEELVSMIRSAQQQDDAMIMNGINVRFTNLSKVSDVKTQIENALENRGLSPYWKVETYQEYDFTKDIMQQLRSEKNLFSLLALIIIIVACSNIISMLIILVNDKKLEIGIFRSMGATTKQIAIIFGFCGIIMGFLGSLFGILAAWITLQNLQSIIQMISTIQGYAAFNPLFYGNSIPNQISLDALIFVVTTTTLISLIAGLVPALKASLLRPSSILKAE